MEEKKIQESKDRQARKYNITLNNPLSMVPPMTHPQIKEEIENSALYLTGVWRMKSG